MGSAKTWTIIIGVFLVAFFIIYQISYTNFKEEKAQNFEREMNFANGKGLRILSFNTWYFGKKCENGMEKLVKHIELLKPDIVALQEVQTPELFADFMTKLGVEWHGIITNNSYPDNAIITTHTIDTSSLVQIPSNKTMGVNIQLKNSSDYISFWAVHLDHHSYGPYAANNRLVTKMEQIMAGEANRNKTGRKDNIQELLATPEFSDAISNADKIPVFVAGDFNCPSHLDWIEENKEIHGGWVVPWPATQALQEKTGLLDSFRELHSDPIKDPGFTWTTMNRYPEWDYQVPEPRDRIDYIFYKSERLKAIKSVIYCGTEPLKEVPDHESNDYPSDHFAVITDFSLV